MSNTSSNVKYHVVSVVILLDVPIHRGFERQILRITESRRRCYDGSYWSELVKGFQMPILAPRLLWPGPEACRNVVAGGVAEQIIGGVDVFSQILHIFADDGAKLAFIVQFFSNWGYRNVLIRPRKRVWTSSQCEVCQKKTNQGSSPPNFVNTTG